MDGRMDHEIKFPRACYSFETALEELRTRPLEQPYCKKAQMDLKKKLPEQQYCKAQKVGAISKQHPVRFNEWTDHHPVRFNELTGDHH